MRRVRITFGLIITASLIAGVSLSARAVRWEQCSNIGKENGKFKTNKCVEEGGAKEWEWQLLSGTKNISATKEVSSVSSNVELVDKNAAGGELKIRCEASGSGWISTLFTESKSEGHIETRSEGIYDGTSQIKFSHCERIKGFCDAREPTAEPIDLPWGTELKEESGEEYRDIIKSGGKGPGYRIKCTALGLSIKDECFGKTSAKAINASSGAVELNFEVKSEKLECTSGGAGAGEIKGTDAIEQPNGNAIRVA